jgi:hypothetical protein
MRPLIAFLFCWIEAAGTVAHGIAARLASGGFSDAAIQNAAAARMGRDKNRCVALTMTISPTLLSEHFYRPGNDCCTREYSTFARGHRRLIALAIHRFQNKHSPGESHNEETWFHQGFRRRRCAHRSRKREDLNADIEEGHLSSALMHLANISYRVGRSIEFDPAKE